jgi:carboxypeptidase Q
MQWPHLKRKHANPLPIAVTAIENYGRMTRLLKANVPVSVEMDIATHFTGDHEHGFNTIAEIPGTDPNLIDMPLRHYRRLAEADSDDRSEESIAAD